ncbi:MAG: hypothetical protein WC671_01235 [Candidatus Paceibacterota bacterium]|jgi:hypothetical protein
MSKDLTKENSVTGKNKFYTTPVVEQSSLRGKKSKILVLGFLLFVLIGIFGPMVMVHASASDPQEACDTTPPTNAPCVDTFNNQWVITAGQPTIDDTPADPAAPATPNPNQSAFEKEITDNKCSVNPLASGTFWPGCFIQLFYGIFYVIPSWLLYVSAYFFNVLVNITLYSSFLSNPFVREAWGIVRDLSNIFFILILLYIAIKVILGMGGSEVKKMIGSVVIMALLINFSMFFTQVIIDSSNILALIFYNKVSVNTKDAQGNDRPYTSTGNREKDVAGGLVNAFDPTKLVSQEYLDNAKQQEPINGVPVPPAAKVAPGILIGMLLIAGVLMLFAAYCLIIVGLSFLGRLIEFFVLIIFSPFAFMSSVVPSFKKIDSLGWDAWFTRLIKVSFMAPIFMFFLYFIFMLIHADIFKGLQTASSTRMIESLLGIILPALLILVLLLKATDYAKKGSGAIGEMVMKGAKIAGGLALGAGLGATAIAGRSVLGGGGGTLANKLASRANKFGESEWGNRLGMNKVASGLTSVGAFAQKSSFDVRGVKIAGKNLSGATGMNLGEAQKGGIAQTRKEKVEKNIKRAKGLEVREDESLKQALNKTEMDLQALLSTNAQEISTLDKTIEKKRQEAVDAERDFKAGTITQLELQTKTNALKNAKQDKTAFMKGESYMTLDSAGKAYERKGTGKNIDALEKLQKEQIQTIKTENVRRRQAYAQRIVKFSFGNDRGFNKEAAHKIMTEVKLDSGTKT